MGQRAPALCGQRFALRSVAPTTLWLPNGIISRTSAYSHEIGTLFSPISAPFSPTSAGEELDPHPAYPVKARAIFKGADFHANRVPRLSENRVPKFVQFCSGSAARSRLDEVVVKQPEPVSNSSSSPKGATGAIQLSHS